MRMRFSVTGATAAEISARAHETVAKFTDGAEALLEFDIEPEVHATDGEVRLWRAEVHAEVWDT